jgi:hypothetical protein
MWIQDTDTEFTTPIVATFESQPSHVSWNLHMPWEAAVVLETGEVCLFDIQNSGSSSSKSSSLNLTAKRAYKPLKKVPPTTALSATTHSDREANLELINSEQSNSANLFSSAPALQWWECEFAWHPKTLLLAGTKEVSLVDFRIPHVGRRAQVGSQQLAMGEMEGNCNTSIVATVPGTGNTPSYCKRTSQNDIFLSFARATYDGMYQFVTSTKQHLILFDTRRPQTPVLQVGRLAASSEFGFRTSCGGDSCIFIKYLNEPDTESHCTLRYKSGILIILLWTIIWWVLGLWISVGAWNGNSASRPFVNVPPF